MANNWQKSGANHVPAYQMSGIPFVTSSVNNTEVDSSAASAPDNKPTRISFPFVTKTLTIRNTGANELRVAFTYSGSYAPGETLTSGVTKKAGEILVDYRSGVEFGRHYFLIPTGSGAQAHSAAGSVQSFDIRCKDLFLLGDGGTTGFSLLAGLTTIPASNFPILTGSITGSATSQYTAGIIPAFDGVG